MIETIPPIPTLLSIPECCDTCRFSTQEPGGANLFCRRYPPTTFVIGVTRDDTTKRINGNEQLACMPIVSSLQWCGEWKPKPTDVN